MGPGGMGDGTGIPEGDQATGEALVTLYMNRIRKFVCLCVCLFVCLFVCVYF